MPEERIELVDANITQSEAGRYMSGLELDLIAYYKTLESEILQISEKGKTPEEIIEKINALFIEPKKEDVEKSEDNMPNKIEKACVPKPGEKKSDFISRCIRTARHDGKDQDEAKGMCYGIWNKKAAKTKKEMLYNQLNKELKKLDKEIERRR
jgi:hypothetical protein